MLSQTQEILEVDEEFDKEALRDGLKGKEETINVNQEETEMYSYLILFISVVLSIFTYLTNHPGQCARLVGPFQERRHEP